MRLRLRHAAPSALNKAVADGPAFEPDVPLLLLGAEGALALQPGRPAGVEGTVVLLRLTRCLELFTAVFRLRESCSPPSQPSCRCGDEEEEENDYKKEKSGCLPQSENVRKQR